MKSWVRDLLLLMDLTVRVLSLVILMRENLLGLSGIVASSVLALTHFKTMREAPQTPFPSLDVQRLVLGT